MDFSNDGTWDQLFWSLEVRTDTQSVDLVLGPNVLLGNSMTESGIESDLTALFSRSAWYLPTDYPIEFRYTVSEGGPGQLGVSVQGNADAVDYSSDIPTLSEWGLIIFGVVLLGFITWVFLRRRKAAAVSLVEP